MSMGVTWIVQLFEIILVHLLVSFCQSNLRDVPWLLTWRSASFVTSSDGWKYFRYNRNLAQVHSFCWSNRVLENGKCYFPFPSLLHTSRSFRFFKSFIIKVSAFSFVSPVEKHCWKESRLFLITSQTEFGMNWGKKLEKIWPGLMKVILVYTISCLILDS